MTGPVRRPGVRLGYDLWAPCYETTSNPIVHLDRRHVLHALDAQPGETILDAGCGTGNHLVTLRHQGARAIGIDFSVGMLQQALHNVSAARLVLGDLHVPLPFVAAAFDAVLCSLVSEHLEHLSTFFTEVFRVLVPGGRLVFSAFHPELARAGVEANFEIDGIEYRLGAERHDEEDFRDAMRSAGLQRVESATIPGDAQLVEAIPDAARYLGRSLLLLMQARRP
jgi:ubiquinone/menaquinone biosynthesis C-methylase UbiE